MNHGHFVPFCGNRSLKRVQAVITNRGIVGIGDFIPLEVQKKRKRKQKKNWFSLLNKQTHIVYTV